MVYKYYNLKTVGFKCRLGIKLTQFIPSGPYFPTGHTAPNSPKCSIVLTIKNKKMLLNVYCEIFGSSSYGEGRTSLRVRLHHMHECRVFHIIHHRRRKVLNI